MKGKLLQLTPDGYRHLIELRDWVKREIAESNEGEGWKRLMGTRLANIEHHLKVQKTIPIPAPKGYQPIFWRYPQGGPDLWDQVLSAPDPKQEGIARYF